jgi:hypothetical protein
MKFKPISNKKDFPEGSLFYDVLKKPTYRRFFTTATITRQVIAIAITITLGFTAATFFCVCSMIIDVLNINFFILYRKNIIKVLQKN